MPLSIWLAALAIASALPLAWWATSNARVAADARARANLSAGVRKVTDLREVMLQQPTSDRVLRPMTDSIARQVRRVTPAGYSERLDRRLQMSGYGERWSIEQMLAAKFGAACGGFFVGLVFWISQPTTFRFILFIILGIVFSFIPDIMLSRRADDRQAEIERALADSLDQITVCVEAGLSFEAALARVAASKGPLADEFGRLLQDIQIGIPRQRALESLLTRTDVPDLRLFVNAMNHAERYGIPIAHVLRVQASELREKRRQRAEERAIKMPVKLVFPVVMCILPALFIVVAGPAAVRVSQIF